MKKILLGIGILMLIGLVVNVSATTATNLVVDYDSTQVDTSLRPGDSGILTVVLSNTGGYAAEGVELWIPDTEGVHAPKRWYLGNIEASSTKTVSTSIRVDGDARVGLHTIQARLTYDSTKSDGTKENDKTSSWDIPLRVYGQANFQFNVADDEYTGDTVGKLTVDVKPKVNVREVSSTLSSSCASIIGSGKQYLGDMTAGGDYSIVYSIKPSQSGICSLTMLLDYYDASGSSSKENASIGINVERSSIDLRVIDIEDGELTLGGQAYITLNIKNLGNTPASDITATLNLSSPFTPIKSSQTYIGDIASGSIGDAMFTISVDSSAQKKSYSIPVTIEYYDQAGTKQTTSINIGLAVDGSAEIEVNLDEKETLVPGMSGIVTIGVVNIGFVDAKFLTLKLLDTENYHVTSADSTYIGSLNSDDSDAEDYTINVYSNVTDVEIPLRVVVIQGGKQRQTDSERRDD